MFTFPTTIPDNAIDLTPARPEFAKIFHDTVGTTGTDADGFPSVVAPIFQHITDGPRFLTGFDSDLGGIGALPVELDGRFHRDFADALANTIKSGQGDFNAFGLHLVGKNPPPQSGAGAPTQGGGGLQPVAFGTVPFGGPTKSITVRFDNPFDFVVHPTGVKIEQGKLQVFVATSECGASIPALGTCSIVVTFRPLLPGHYAGLLVFNTDDPNSPYTLGLSGTVSPPHIGGGGGGGGGVGCDPRIDPACGGFGDSPPF